MEFESNKVTKKLRASTNVNRQGATRANQHAPAILVIVYGYCEIVALEQFTYSNVHFYGP